MILRGYVANQLRDRIGRNGLDEDQYATGVAVAKLKDAKSEEFDNNRFRAILLALLRVLNRMVRLKIVFLVRRKVV